MATDTEHVDLKQNVLSTFIKVLSINQEERRNAEDKIKILETTESEDCFDINNLLVIWKSGTVFLNEKDKITIIQSAKSSRSFLH